MRNKKNKCGGVNVTHFFSSDHGDDGDALFPHHLPEVGTRVRQGTLRGDVAPLLSAYLYLKRQETDESIIEFSISVFSIHNNSILH